VDKVRVIQTSTKAMICLVAIHLVFGLHGAKHVRGVRRPGEAHLWWLLLSRVRRFGWWFREVRATSLGG
jgi:hypothetical protein